MVCIKCGGSHHHSFSHVRTNPFFETLSLQYDLLWERATDVALTI